MVSEYLNNFSMKIIIQFFTPPDKWKIPVIFMLAIFFGFLLYAVYISKFSSYLGENPETCVNCHIMSPQYATWSHSSHREYANCNDCHVPHNNIFNKYYFKAKDGMRHAAIFTLRGEPQVIQIKEVSKQAVQKNCERCHNHLINKDRVTSIVGNQYEKENENERYCWECHREVPHGKVNSLSSTPNARIPLLESPVPSWLSNLIKKEKTEK
jgi:cytochrome c nitrite reductase small subunit